MMMRAAILGLQAVVLCGCAFVPVYKVPTDTRIARVRLSESYNSTNLWMCMNDVRYRLQYDPAGYAKVPSGKRLTIGVSFNNYVYNGVSTYCQAASSFIPQADASYYVDFEMESERCTAISYREVTTNRVGLDFEPTLALPPATCFTD